MQLAFAFFAKTGELHKDSSLFSVLSAGFDTLAVEAFPHTILTVGMVARWHLTDEEWCGDHKVRIDIYGPDGNMLPVEGREQRITLSEPIAAPGKGGKITSYVVFHGLELPHVGDYEFHLFIDDVESGVVPLTAKQLPPKEGKS